MPQDETGYRTMHFSDLIDVPLQATTIEGDTRERLLEAGLWLFALHGFDSVSTRQLARTAGVNIAAIAYHFGGKKELYHAVAEQQVKETDSIISPVAARLQAALKDAKGNREALAEIVGDLVLSLLRAFTGSDRMRLRGALIMREYALPTSAFEILFKGRIEPLHKAITALTAAALGRSPEDPATVVRAHAVVGQMIIFFIARIVLFARLGWTAYGEAEFEMIRREATESVLASLGLPLSTEREAAR